MEEDKNVTAMSEEKHPSQGASYTYWAGTWEEKSLNKWATDRIKELLMSVGSLEFSSGKAEIAEVSKCFGIFGDCQKQKRVGYTYELTLKIKGEWIVKEEKKMVKAHIDVPEFCFGELEDLQVCFLFPFECLEYKNELQKVINVGPSSNLE
ncbi:hypothetical protein GH714_042462 [Hevea brasiliensis]|uniref:Activator of Hsp90 ATPase AHSA1-like N-terminal domain-containing protein n=1 Tax=Hevea brasiliensis TaxID=3981 RepID=A0A6A6KVJ7_HEVBR|nr:hypothetical protein GH714_042462 [Hevea brasiliensis]